MNRNGIVINARAMKLGRNALKWAATGMNLGEGREDFVEAVRPFVTCKVAQEAVGFALMDLNPNAARQFTQTDVVNALGVVADLIEGVS